MAAGVFTKITEGFQNLTIMELALLITTPGFVHIFEEIINQMDSKSLVTSSLVCKNWWQVIQNHPKRWRCIIQRIRIKEALIYPDFRRIVQSVGAKKEDIKELGLVLRQFCETEDKRTCSGAKFEGIQGFYTRDKGFFQLVFGDLKRLQYFWPHLPNKNPMFFNDEFSTLHILAKLGHVETFQFIADRVDNVNPCHATPYEHITPLFYAKRFKHFGIVQIIEDKLQNPNKKQKKF